MARSHARIYSRIWANEDFTSLTERAQRLYLLAVSQPNLNYAGVIPYTSKRWSTLATDSKPANLARARAELESAGFVVFDADTDEMMICRFIEHDGVLKSPNMCIAMVKDFNAVLSAQIRSAIMEGLPEPFPEPLTKGFPEGFPGAFGKEFAKRFGEGSPCARAPAPPPLPHTPTPSPSPTPPVVARTLEEAQDLAAPGAEHVTLRFDFAEFWNRYPRQAKRPEAQRAWKAAIGRGARDHEIIEGLDRWTAYWVLDHTDDQFIPHPANFLQADQFRDATPQPAKSNGQRKVSNLHAVVEEFIAREAT